MNEPSSRTLQQALEIVGSRERLCTRLWISAAELEAFLQDRKPVPESVISMARDIVAGKT